MVGASRPRSCCICPLTARWLKGVLRTRRLRYPWSDTRQPGSHGPGWWCWVSVPPGAATALGAVAADITSPTINIIRRLWSIIAVLLRGLGPSDGNRCARPNPQGIRLRDESDLTSSGIMPAW